jgi:hypothetical protein
MEKLINELSYRIGREVGYDLIRFLPVLSTARMGYKVITITHGERTEFDRLEDLWAWNYKKDGSTDENWENLKNFERQLINKYLPSEFTFHTNVLPDGTNVQQFKEGLSEVIFNCDYSCYKCLPKDIELKETEGTFRNILFIKLFLDKKYN